MKKINGGICAPKGFYAAGIHAGIRKNKSKPDLALIKSEVRGTAASCYTQNLVKGAPIWVNKKHLANGTAQAIVCNSGNANTCNADGIEVANKMCAVVAENTGIPEDDIIVASTGVIGLPLDVTPIEKAMPELVRSLKDTGSSEAATAIMTTDTVIKEAAVEFELDGSVCRLGGIAKGSGMIHPNMATMLVFITTDAAITSEMLSKALLADVKDSFNMISVDGDTSTNDMVSVIANGMAGNTPISTENDDFTEFKKALNKVTTELCKKIAKDGEGASKLLECRVTGALTESDAKMTAKSVITSTLFKAAMFGADANWGRVLCAIGYSGANVNVDGIGVVFSSAAGSVEVCRNGSGVNFSEELAKKVLSEDEIIIVITLSDGSCSAVAWGCDLTYDYVK
ncbi:MAG: bifunctional glutamate N-acetyltransferase/amino-acid acetyltransferase ArgJ, partial [Clostridiales bacterium]|nr:bifunctional glutamate N-acetyltransferase/amino-acid acetyltransferase ArgJ [Clostridiales bacterium]